MTVPAAPNRLETGMKITPSIDVTTGKAESATPAGARPVGAGRSEPAASGEGASIHLSELSTQLQALEASLAAGNEFDAGRVEQIKAAIRDGTLSINAPVVADKMLAEVREMLTKAN